MEVELARRIRGDARINGLNLRSQLACVEIDGTGDGHLIHLAYTGTIVTVHPCMTSLRYAVENCAVSSMRMAAMTPDMSVMPAASHMAPTNPIASAANTTDDRADGVAKIPP
jgi:hypothetical protein